ncbi:bifunctional diaminohydroxyphosphoribosylaminopyrimidine deaminase/5-amino-6-(5-phosphoribosylamino)uracil reductase RibD [Acidithiobacillus concretivorus]|uniref:Riboflavin biosynthesis protein RibD n=1 Tax=Acidithiobacillus concretivorus TaxID=3063952 RepID=A0ABS5ZL36_9PROT|nr:bifunctional diaminohydroxyphosphoribosylaminopyrimidine deaminase/5-amino-6-(5-phosphoribosylamino)uracil reductase RibD [Acidithiobacillus concretivorus]
MLTEQDHQFMEMALDLAKRGLYSTHPNPRVGAVVVQDGIIVGRGAHLFAGEVHAEVLALAEAGAASCAATVYVTLEPCSHQGRTGPCADALVAAGVARVVVAAQDPNPLVSGQGIARLRAAGIQVDLGCCEAESRALNPGFFMRMEGGRPWIRLKQAISLDAGVALANGQSQWLTGTLARADVQKERAGSSAILVGIGTVLADNPRLAPRLDTPLRRYPVKVVMDTHLRTPADAALFASPGAVWICHGPGLPDSAKKMLQAAGAELLVVPVNGEHLDCPAVMRILAEKQINELLVEAGPGLASSLFAAGLVDEWLLYMAPMLLGQGALPAMQVGPFQQLIEAPRWRSLRVESLGNDLKWTLGPQEC